MFVRGGAHEEAEGVVGDGFDEDVDYGGKVVELEGSDVHCETLCESCSSERLRYDGETG